ncbi:MAG: trypsin-like peptidase domain-containing protein [Deltaproteobacteria bacterium]
MTDSNSRLAVRARWIGTLTITCAIAGLAVPALLHAQARPAAGTVAAPPPAAGTVVVPQVATTPAAPPTPAAADALLLGQAFTDVAQRMLPSVVSIHVEVAEEGGDVAPFMMPGHPGMPGMPGMPGFGHNGQAPLMRGEGSGVIVRADGVILTNNHVVEHARRITVRLHDGRSFRARVLGTDAPSDLAIVRIDGTNLPVARLGDSDQARVGEFVLAIGAPLGLEATVTHGVVSATGRGGLGANEIEDYLQTDASINPGNSGGPLVNLRGEVLGINTMIIGRNTGIGLAVPSRMAQSVIEQVLLTGHVTRGWIGVGVQDLAPDLAISMGAPSLRGAIVNQIEPGAPAARAGLEIGDVVTALDGHPVVSSLELIRLVTRHGVGDRVPVSLVRDGRPRALTVVTGPRPGAEGAIAADDAAALRSAAPSQNGLGLRLASLSPELAARLAVEPSAIVVAGVDPGSAADEAGLRRGDVILRADGRAVRGSQDVTAAAQDRRVTLLVRRGRAQMFVPILLE